MTRIIGIDHIYISVSNLEHSRVFYDRVFLGVFGFRSNSFTLGGDPHVQYYNQHLGYVLRPARVAQALQPYAPGLHHLCLRVETVDGVRAVSAALNAAGIAATPAALHGDYAPDYWATFFNDPDGLRLEVTNYRQERRERHDRWDGLPD